MIHDSKNFETKIGLFDSGVGGLSILKSFQRAVIGQEKQTRFVYLADTGRCPYGDRSSAEIRCFAEQFVQFLNAVGVEKIVMACNSSAAVAADLAREIAQVPVYDLISSAALYAAENFKNVGVIATSITCKSKAFSRSIAAIEPACRVHELPCPDLVPLVERGLLNGPLVEKTISKYAMYMKEKNIDSLIFGCTHFPFLEEAFRAQLPDNVTFIDPAVRVSQEIFGKNPFFPARSELQAAFLKNSYFCTGDPDKFAVAAERCLDLDSGILKESVSALSLEKLHSCTYVLQEGSSNILLNNPLFGQSTPTA